MNLQRHNIFELIGGRQNLYHSAVLTSYTFDPIFFESFYLPRLRQCGITNVVVLLDAANYDRTLAEYTSFGVEPDRRLYTLIRQTPSNTGVFHPKISMLIGEDAGLCVVGSGNLTYNGQALNEEVWNTFSLKGADSVYLPLFRNVWRYLNGLKLPESMLLRQQLKWMTDNAGWLSAEGEEDAVTVDSQKFLFLANNADGTVLSKLTALVGDEPVRSITTVAPFYDTLGVMLTAFFERFRPREIRCVYSEAGIYPFDLMMNKPDWLTFYSWSNVFTSGRNLHAKIVQLELPSRTILLSGSANITNAAFTGKGDEACIAIISDPHKDFIIELGIELNIQTVTAQTQLGALSKPERLSVDSTEKRARIISAEVVDHTLTVITDGGDMTDCRLGILDTEGKTMQLLNPENADGKLRQKSFTLTGSIAVIVDGDNSEVSNRCFILSEEDVARFNPNKALRKLRSFLESDKDWKNNLEAILSYLWFDDSPSPGTPGQSAAHSTTIKKEVAGHSVERNEFDNIRVGSRQALMSLPDIHILDLLLSPDRKDVEQSADDTESVDDVDAGGNEYAGSEQSIKKRRQETAFIDSVRNYSRRLRKHYDVRLENLYSVAANFGADIFKAAFRDKAEYVSVTDYSRILIDVVLIWKILSEYPADKHEEAKQDFIRNLGKFLLLARKGYLQTNDYAWHKCVEFHKELIVFSLLVIASRNWRKDTVDVKLLIANLLTSWADPEEIVGEFLKKAEESKTVVNPDSMALIEKTSTEYKAFTQHRASSDLTMVREVDFERDNYAFKSGYGFFYVAGMEVLTQTAYRMYLLHPGFDNVIEVAGSNKIRALS